MTTSLDELSLAIAGATITPKHFDASLKIIHSAHNDAIGAPKVMSSSVVVLINTHHHRYPVLAGVMLER